MAASISHFLTAITKIHVVLLTKKMSAFFLSLALDLDLSLFFSLSFVGLPPTFSFSPSLSCFKTTRIQKQFPLSVFVFIDSFVVSALQDAGGYAISRQNNLELHLGCHTC